MCTIRQLRSRSIGSLVSRQTLGVGTPHRRSLFTPRSFIKKNLNSPLNTLRLLGDCASQGLRTLDSVDWSMRTGVHDLGAVAEVGGGGGGLGEVRQGQQHQDYDMPVPWRAVLLLPEVPIRRGPLPEVGLLHFA